MSARNSSSGIVPSPSSARQLDAAAPPRRHHDEHAARRPRAGTSRRRAILAAFAAKNARSIARNGMRNAQRRGLRVAPAPAQTTVEQVRRDRHRAGHRDAVRGREAGARCGTGARARRSRPSAASSSRGCRSGPRSCADVWTTVTRGQNPSCIAWRVSENTPEISACDAMIAAIVASTSIGISSGPSASA